MHSLAKNSVSNHLVLEEVKLKEMPIEVRSGNLWGQRGNTYAVETDRATWSDGA